MPSGVVALCGIILSMKSVQQRLKEAFGPRTRGRNLLITVLLVLCAIEINALTHQVRVAEQMDAARSSYERAHQLDKNDPDATQIQVWMTFDYLNTVFKLPPSYLKSTLNISDPKYPNIHIGGYAKDENLNPAHALDLVKSAITSYGQAANPS